MNVTSHRISSTSRRVLVLLVGAAVIVIGCSTGATTEPSRSPGSSAADPTPTIAVTPGRLDHATGHTDVVFRFEEGGGFVPMGFFATEAPILTLYGDGTVIFRDGTAAPPPESDGIIRQLPFQTVRLSEDQIQAFLESAIADGGLGTAREQYSGPGADLPTAVFTIRAGGQTKTVSVSGLGMDRGEGGPDALILRALAALGDRVRAFGGEVDGEEVWSPDRWRGVLTADALNPPRNWPWPGISPADFIQRPEPGAPQFPIRTMTPAEVADLGLANIDGGFSGLALSGPDGKVYFFGLRPLLPDESF